MTKIIPLSKGEKKSYPKQEICRVCKKKIIQNYNDGIL